MRRKKFGIFIFLQKKALRYIELINFKSVVEIVFLEKNEFSKMYSLTRVMQKVYLAFKWGGETGLRVGLHAETLVEVN